MERIVKNLLSAGYRSSSIDYAIEDLFEVKKDPRITLKYFSVNVSNISSYFFYFIIMF